jgi:hypothetical protein
MPYLFGVLHCLAIWNLLSFSPLIAIYILLVLYIYASYILWSPSHSILICNFNPKFIHYLPMKHKNPCRLQFFLTFLLNTYRTVRLVLTLMHNGFTQTAQSLLKLKPNPQSLLFPAPNVNWASGPDLYS